MEDQIVPPGSVNSRIVEIWSDDLLDRRYDAQAVQQFCVDRTKALRQAGRHGAFTLGIDAEYGVGKSFFLKKLFDQVSLRHPAAFIDAWADDTIDAPWSALMVAIDAALSPFKSQLDAAKTIDVKKKVGAVLTALAKNAAKKGTSYVIGDDGWDDVVDAAFEKEGEKIVSDFQARKKSIIELKESLEALFTSLGDYAEEPIFIFVDELDRCRPTYAIKMLEEMKHLFDVSGVVFVLALNQAQLIESIKSVYGSNFDSRDYLRRFVEKVYTLPSPSSIRLVEYYLIKCGFDTNRFASPDFSQSRHEDANISYIAECMESWQCTPRNIIKVVDGILTASSLWALPCKIILPVLVPLVFKEVMNEGEGFLDRNYSDKSAVIALMQGHSTDPHTVNSLYRHLKQSSHRTYREFINFHGHGSVVTQTDAYLQQLFIEEHQSRQPFDPNFQTSLVHYEELVKTLSHIE